MFLFHLYLSFFKFFKHSFTFFTFFDDNFVGVDATAPRVCKKVLHHCSKFPCINCHESAKCVKEKRYRR